MLCTIVLQHTHKTTEPGGIHGEARHGPNIKEGEDTRQEQEQFVVYLAYQPVENITSAKIMAETVLFTVDINIKKKKLLHLLRDLKMSTPMDDTIRRVISDVKEFTGKDQVETLHQVKEMKDLSKLSIVSQFIQLLKAGRQQQ